MLFMMQLKKNGNVETGIFDDYNCNLPSYTGLIKYLQDQGYKDISIYAPKGEIDPQQIINYKSFQKEFASALGSIKYYPRNEVNDYARTLYAKSHPVNMDFRVPENKPGTMY